MERQAAAPALEGLRELALTPLLPAHPPPPAADGYVRSEACALALLSAQLEHGGADGLLVLLAGTAVNQGGRASSLTAPNGPSQQEVVRLALRGAGLAVRQVAGLQLHGTGTSLGDPIEVGAAAGLLLEGRPQPFPLLASKSGLGHSEPASGIMGLSRLYQVGRTCLWCCPRCAAWG